MPKPSLRAGHRGGVPPRRPDHRDLVRSPDPGFMPACKRGAGRAGDARAAAGPGRGRHARSAPTSPPRARELAAAARHRGRDRARRTAWRSSPPPPTPPPPGPTSSSTDKERYRELTEDYQALARRQVISGMHVHAEIEDEDLRIDLMNQVGYFLPHLLALSTSSPFWGGQETGLKVDPAARSPTTCRARARPSGSRAGANGSACSRSWPRSGWSTTRPRSGGTSGRRPSIRRWSCGSPTSAPTSRTR